MADIIDLIYADHDWLRRQFFRLDDATVQRRTRRRSGVLRACAWTRTPTPRRRFSIPRCSNTVVGTTPEIPEGDPEDETEDAITDHNAIRDAVRQSRRHEPGTDKWFEAVICCAQGKR